MSFILPIISMLIFGFFALYGSTSTDPSLNIMGLFAIPFMIISAIIAYISVRKTKPQV